MASCSVVALAALSSALPNPVEILHRSELEELRVGTERTIQVLQHIQQLLALKGQEQAKLQGLLVVLERQVSSKIVTLLAEELSNSMQVAQAIATVEVCTSLTARSELCKRKIL